MNTIEKLVASIISMKKLRITYTDETDIKQYTVLPHLIGKFKSTGNLVLSAYSDSEINACWKTFLLANIKDAEILEGGFEHTAAGYNPKDKRMAAIICSIPAIQ